MLESWKSHPLPTLALLSSCSKVLCCTSSAPYTSCDMETECSSRETSAQEDNHEELAVDGGMVVDSGSRFIVAAS